MRTRLLFTFQNDSNSFVFGINGRWGSGKSTLLSYLQDSLKARLTDNDKYVFVDFNPWAHSNSGNLLRAFLKTFLQAIGSAKERFRNVSKILKYAQFLKPLEAFIPPSSAVFSLLEKLVADPEDSSLKEEIDQQLVEKQLKIFVFIDDLDRLTPAEIVDVFQLLKLNASFKNTIFIVSFDKEVVQDALTTAYKLDGEKYLEKIVQVDYRLPDILDDHLEAQFLSNCETLFTQLDIQFDVEVLKSIWIVHRLRYYFQTIRDLHRYFNALKLRLPAIKEEVYLYHFLVVEAIRIFDYKAYEDLQQHYKRELQFGEGKSGLIQDRLTNDTTLALFKYCFNSYNQQAVSLSVSNPNFFDRYFALAIGSRDIEEKTVRHFIDDPRHRRYIFDQALNQGTVNRLLERLQEKEINLEFITPLLDWPASSERQFIYCIESFLKTINKAVRHEKDLKASLAYFFSLLGADDGHFNPAKFYLLYLLTNWNRVADFGFTDCFDIIESHNDDLNKRQKDLLARWHSDNIIFTRSEFKTDFFHGLFLAEYNRLLPADYEKLFKIYFEKSQNQFHILRIIIKPGNPDGHKIFEFFVKSLFSEDQFNDFSVQLEKTDPNRLSSEEAILFNSFLALKDQIRRLIIMRQSEKYTNQEIVDR